jgi:HD-GYP domain-containing protein (c-di-GMP phosphodiesterase class II)
MTGKRLSAPERAKLATHPIIGFNIVKENDFPLAVQLGVLEHHERENGTGYPRKLTGNKISLYAKIIAVACSFEAITAPRMFKEARSTYDAMIEVLKNEGKQFDDTVIKALLYSLSLFPIGAYVYLQNGKIAQVTDVNPTDPRNPVVQILGETDETGGPKTVQTDNGTMRIVRVLNKSEAADILKQFNINK